MALYNHVSGKQDLMEAIAQAVVEELRIPPAMSDWQETIRGIFRALRQVCLANPRSIPVIKRAEILPAIFRPMEAALLPSSAPALDRGKVCKLADKFYLGTDFL
jgi:TetR/AcrR family tetracycline transcriptional repressor